MTVKFVTTVNLVLTTNVTAAVGVVMAAEAMPLATGTVTARSDHRPTPAQRTANRTPRISPVPSC